MHFQRTLFVRSHASQQCIVQASPLASTLGALPLTSLTSCDEGTLASVPTMHCSPSLHGKASVQPAQQCIVQAWTQGKALHARHPNNALLSLPSRTVRHPNSALVACLATPPISPPL